MMGLGRPTTMTPLYADMVIAAKFLHRSHAEFLALPSLEREKLRIFLRAWMEHEAQQLRDTTPGPLGLTDKPKQEL